MVYILIKLDLKKSCSLPSKPHCATKLGPSSIGRTVLAMLLVMAKKGVWVLEQPSSSLVFRLQRFQDHLVCKTRASYLHSAFWGLAGCWFEHVIYLLYIIYRFYSIKKDAYKKTFFEIFLRLSQLEWHAVKVYKQSFWMRAFGARTPKRTTLWSNSSGVRFFCTSKKAGSTKAKKGPKLADVYFDKAGRKRYKGNGNLRKSQFWP